MNKQNLEINHNNNSNFLSESSERVKWKNRNKNNAWSGALQVHSLTKSTMLEKATVQSQKRVILHQVIAEADQQRQNIVSFNNYRAM